MTGFRIECMVLSLILSIAVFAVHQPNERAVVTLSSTQQIGSPPIYSEMGLHLVFSNGVESKRDNVGVHEIGQIDRFDRTHYRHEFLFVNDNPSALSHLRVHYARSEGVSILAALTGSSSAPQPLASDEELPPLRSKRKLSLFVTLDLLHLPPGPFHPTITVMMPGVDQPIAMLEITGTLLPVVTFSPASLDFGRVPSGQTQTLSLTLHIDPRLTPEGATPRLFCTNTSVLIQPVPLDPAFVRKSSLLNKKQQSSGLFSYLLTLSADASMGQVSGSLIVAGIDPPPPGLEPPPASSSVDPSLVLEALHTASAEVMGRVEGDVSAAPTEVFFSRVTQGKEAVQSVWLTPKTAKALEGVQFNCPVAWLSARLIAPPGTLQAQPRALSQRGAKDATQRKTAKAHKGKRHAALPPSEGQAKGKSASSAQGRSSLSFAPFRGTFLSRRWALEVILSPHAPVGRLQTQMILTLANGQRLVLPVVAVVQANPAPK